MINLGKKCETCEVPTQMKSEKNKVYYPTLYISGIKGLDLSVGDIEFHAKGKVISVSERESMRNGEPSEDYSVEIEIREMVPMSMDEMNDSASGLEDAMNSIAAKKSKKIMVIEDTEEEDEGEEMEEEEEMDEEEKY